jgi:hypothetical protein
LATKELAVASQHTVLHFLFHQGIFLPKTTRLLFPTHPTFLFSQFKIELKGRHFDTTEVIEADSQAMLNTHTEHDFQDAFKKSQKCWEGDYFEGDGGQ